MSRRPRSNKSDRSPETNDDVVWSGIDLDRYEEVELAPVERRRHATREHVLPLETIYEEEEPTEKYQFSIRHLLMAQAAIAVLLCILRVFAPSWLAGTLGVAALVLAIQLSIHQPDDRRIQIAWWVLFAFYLITCVAAMLTS